MELLYSSQKPCPKIPWDGALASTKWAWVELNYRPHAYQAETKRWLAPMTVGPAWFSSLRRRLALAGACAC